MAYDTSKNSPQVDEEETYQYVCSLSAQLAIVRRYGYRLLFFTGFDAGFVHEETVREFREEFGEGGQYESPVLRDYMAATLDGSPPELDEFECFRRAGSQAPRMDLVRRWMLEVDSESAAQEAREYLQPANEKHGKEVFRTEL